MRINKTEEKTSIFYGMRLRGYSIGCQPMTNLIRRHDDETGKYYDILEYSEKLTNKEIEIYSLDELEERKKKDD